jgi:hypothetical protein
MNGSQGKVYGGIGKCRTPQQYHLDNPICKKFDRQQAGFPLFQGFSAQSTIFPPYISFVHCAKHYFTACHIT